MNSSPARSWSMPWQIEAYRSLNGTLLFCVFCRDAEGRRFELRGKSGKARAFRTEYAANVALAKVQQ